MKVQKAELAQKIAKIKSVVPKKASMPVLQGILVKDGYLIANNTEMTVKAKLEGIESESFIIPAKAFDLIANLPEGELEILLGENNVITIKADKIKNTYQSSDSEVFPVAEISGENQSELTIKSNVLLESIKRVAYAIPNQSANQVMTALCLQAAGGSLNFIGLDGHVLAWDRIDFEGEFELLIPKNTVEKLQSVGLSGDVSIKYGPFGAVFATEDYEIYTRIINGEYFKYQQMFGELPLQTSVNREDFLAAMVRAKMCTEEKSPVCFQISADVMNISIKDKLVDYYETIQLQEKLAKELTIGFNAKLVVETLKAFDCENIKIYLAGPRQPMIVKAEDSEFKAIILPVALR